MRRHVKLLSFLSPSAGLVLEDVEGPSSTVRLGVMADIMPRLGFRFIPSFAVGNVSLLNLKSSDAADLLNCCKLS